MWRAHIVTGLQQLWPAVSCMLSTHGLHDTVRARSQRSSLHWRTYVLDSHTHRHTRRAHIPMELQVDDAPQHHTQRSLHLRGSVFKRQASDRPHEREARTDWGQRSTCTACCPSWVGDGAPMPRSEELEPSAPRAELGKALSALSAGSLPSWRRLAEQRSNSPQSGRTRLKRSSAALAARKM